MQCNVDTTMCMSLTLCLCCRYRDVYPYDHSRVSLSSVTNTDYINASLVTVDTLHRSYILTQVRHTMTISGSQ